jgi:manganese-dependent inorganic pyrophosphatase
MAKRQPATQPILVVGHQRPDTDSAVSAAVYAALLKGTARGGETYEGVILGEPTAQTKWLFAEAGVPLPRVVGHLRPLVREVARQEVFSVGTDAALGDALELIMRRRISVVPVLDADKKLLGLLSDRMPMANYFYHANAEDFLGVLFAVADLERYLRLSRWQKPRTEAEGQIVLDLSRLAPGSLALIGDEPEKLRLCHDAGAAVVIVCARKKSAAWKKMLRACPGLGVLQYSGSLMALVTQLPMAIPATRLMQSDDFPMLVPEQPVHEAQAALRQSPFALPVLNPDGTLHGVLSRTEILSAARRRVVLVDHFEQHQAAEGIADAEILEIVDHHRVGTLETPQPIRVDCRPVGSTATIIACKFAEHARRPSPAQAQLLLGAIVADTLLLTSPTTTEVDRQQAASLARIARVNLHSFGREVLVRNDETLERPAAELVEKDLKEFAGGGAKFAVAQIETVDRTRLDATHLANFATALRERRQNGGWDFAALLITDIFRGDSIVLFDARTSGLARQLGPSGEVWAGCVSRKKQFLPELLCRLDRGESR